MKITVLSGAGISAESGIRTFRDSDGLWEEYDVRDVASIDGWNRNAALVQRFYNERRKQLQEVEPNAAHQILAAMERDFTVHIVTQNVDDLHERAGSRNVLHLHGELTKARSVADANLVYQIGYRAILPEERADDGAILRPDIVWFGEAVPRIEKAAALVADADVLIVVGTSLNVYPAAGLLDYAAHGADIYIIDPAEVKYSGHRKIIFIKEKASVGMEKVHEYLRKKHGN